MSFSAAPADVLVTGAHGFVGQALLRHLESVGGLRVAGGSRADANLAERPAAEALLRQWRPRTVVHLAAVLPGREGREERERQWRDTFLPGRNILEACADAGVARVLVAGSIAELGRCSGTLEPTLPIQPFDYYGLCKAMVFEVASFLARTTPLCVDWFRPFTVYGPGQVGPMLVPTAFASAANGRPADFTDGFQERDFLFVEDLVRWIAGGIATEPAVTERGRIGVHHVGTGQGTAVRDVLDRIASLFPGADFRLGALARREEEPPTQIAGKAAPPWPWVPETGLEEGLRITADWWRARSGAVATFPSVRVATD